MKSFDIDPIMAQLLQELTSQARLEGAGIKDVAYALKVLNQLRRDAAVMERGFDAPGHWLERMIEEADEICPV